MCPIMMTVLNLPEHLRNNPANMLLIGIIPGPHSPSYMAPYLDPLVDELLELKSPGVIAIDGSRNNEEFVLHARLMTVVADYPGHGQLMEMKTNGYYACHKCKIKVTTHGRDDGVVSTHDCSASWELSLPVTVHMFSFPLFHCLGKIQ